MSQHFASTQFQDLCSRVATGREAARELTEFVENYGLKEAEFRLLWALLNSDTELDQTCLAALLGCSPAQVSALVERLRSRGQIVTQAASRDRRRHCWHITPQGRALVEQIVAFKSTSKATSECGRQAA